jgi:hypothetical protein
MGNDRQGGYPEDSGGAIKYKIKAKVKTEKVIFLDLCLNLYLIMTEAKW